MNNLINFGSLALMGIVFIIWVFFMSRTLFALLAISTKRRAAEDAGFFRWLGISLGVYGEFFTAAEHRTERRRILFLTVLLFAIIIGRIPLLSAL